MKLFGTAPEKHLNVIADFGRFIEADSIEYIDHGKRESYIIKKNNIKYVMDTDCNPEEGAYINFELLEEVNG